VKLPILNDSGEPLHERGVTQYPGLYFLGLRRTYALSSAGGRRQGRGFHCRPHRRKTVTVVSASLHNGLVWNRTRASNRPALLE